MHYRMSCVLLFSSRSRFVAIPPLFTQRKHHTKFEILQSQHQQMSVSDSRDTIESEIKRLLDDLLQCASTVHAHTVLRDAVWAIEDRASSRTDALARDNYVEQRVRDVLGELSKPGSTPQSYEIAIEFVDALLPIDFTERNYKFARLCRSLLVILQCGHDGIAKFAQRVFMRMVKNDVDVLQKDPHASTPLKDFLPKELKEMCETVSREADGRGTPSRNKSLAVMVASEAVMEVYPRYVSNSLRAALIELAIDLCGRPDLSVRCAAYDCLVATLTNTGGLKPADILAESRRLADECTKSLRASHVTDHQSTSTILSLRALLVSRGVTAVDKQFFNMFCTTLLEQHKKAKGDLVRSAVCSLVPIVARADPNFSSRRIAYATILMDPLKNIRDESNKMTELHNMAEYVRSAGYDSLDASMKPSIEQLLLRYVTRPQTQLECWNLLAAMTSQPSASPGAERSAGSTAAHQLRPTANSASSVKLIEMIRKCLPNLARAPLTEKLLEYLELIKNSVQPVAAEVATAKRNLIDIVLRRAAQAESTPFASSHRHGTQWPGSSPAEPFLGSPAALVGSHNQHSGSPSLLTASFASASSSGSPGSQHPQQAGNTGRAFGNLGRLVSSYFHRGGSNHPDGGSNDEAILVSASEIEVALVALPLRQVDDFNGLIEELRVNIIALQRHSNSQVRRQCSVTILQCVECACSAAGSKQGTISAENASHFFSRVEDLLESYLKNAVMELEPQCRMIMVETFCKSRSAMQLINRPKILSTLMSFLNDTSRIREVVVRAFVEACQSLKKDGVDVSDVEKQLKVTVETSVVALEYSSETRLLLRHLGDLVIFTRLGIDPILPLMTRTFVALNRKLGSSDVEMDVVVLTILKTLKCLVSPLVTNDTVGRRFLDEITILQNTVLGILWNSTATIISIEAVRVLVSLNNVSPLILNISSSDAMRTIDTLSSTFLDSKHIPRDDIVALMTLFGQLGAIRPTKGTLEVRSEEEQSKLASDADLVITFDYAVIVYRSISRMLETSLPETIACQSMKVLLQLVNATTKDEIGGVHALKAVLNLIKLRCDSPTLRVEALYQLAALISKRHQNTIAFMLPEIVVLLDQLWSHSDGSTHFCAVLEVITALEPGQLPAKEQHDMWPWLYPRLIDAVLRDSSPNGEIALKIVEIVKINAKSIPPHCVPFITSALTNVIQQSDQPSDLRAAAIVAVVDVVNSLDLIQFVTPLLHALRTLHRHLELTHSLARRFGVEVRDALRRFIKKFPSSRTIVSGVVDLLETSDNHHNDEHDLTPRRQTAVSYQNNNPYSNVVSQTSSRRTLDGNDPLFHVASSNSDGSAPPAAVSLSEPNRGDLMNLQNHIERGIRITDHSRWRDWYQELQRLVMLCSPHFAFRLVTELFEKHEPLRRDLFFAGFKCLYETLAVEQVRRVNLAIAHAITSNDGEVSAKCLALADYLDHNKPNWEKRVGQGLNARSDAGSPGNGSASMTMGTVKPSYLQSMQRHTPMKTLTQNFSDDGLDDPNFFHSPTSLGKKTAGRMQFKKSLRGTGGPSLLQGSMAFPATPMNELPAIALKRHNRSKDVYGAASDLNALQDKEGRMSFPDSSVIPRTAQKHLSVAGDVNVPKVQPHQRGLTKSVVRTSNCVTLIPGESPLVASKITIEAAKASRMFEKAIRFLEMKLVPYLGASLACGKLSKPIDRLNMEKVVLPLSQLYSSLEMQDSVVGLFSSIHYLDSQETTGIGLELLRKWSDARNAYSSALTSPSPGIVTDQCREGYVRTLCMCGEWRSALSAAKEFVRGSTPVVASAVAASNVSVSGATAAWILSEWDDVADFSQRITDEPLQFFFVNGVVFNRNSDTPQNPKDQLECIRLSKLTLEASLKSLLPVSYSHAYDSIALLQNFQEIWEAIAFKQAKTISRRTQIKDMWAARANSMKSDNWFVKLRSLMIHSLVLAPADMPDTWLQFCETVRPTYPQLSNWGMRSLQLGRLASTASDDIAPAIVAKGIPSVRVGYFMHLWNNGKLSEALAGMQSLVAPVKHTCGCKLAEIDPRSYGMGQLKLGLWKQEMHADAFWKGQLRDEIIDHLHSAIRSCPDDYDTWHAWALMNYRIQQRESALDRRSQSIFVSKAHEGFVAAICLSPSAAISLQDVMRLLQLWFVQNGVELLKESIADAVQRISVEHWIQVVPQLIAHLGHHSHDVRDVVFRILQKIAIAHPQVVVFPLLVNTLQDPNVLPTTSAEVTHRDALSISLLDKYVPQRIRRDAEYAGRQLCIAALLPIEHILEMMTLVAEEWTNLDAVQSPTKSTISTPFVADVDVSFPVPTDVPVNNDSMAAVTVAQNAHRRTISTADKSTTSSDDEGTTRAVRRMQNVIYIFQNEPSLRLLGDIGKYSQQVIDLARSGQRDNARSLLEQLIEEITEHVKKIRKAGEDALKSVEPLSTLRNLSVSMFGEYNWTNPSQVPTIASFSTQCDVIRSKKRPRKIRATGTNGSVYAFLLKSNEDIRLDERVMQLFGLVNSFVELQKHSANCMITKFPVVPISANVGLLGWVEYSDTLHDVISNYRTLSNADGYLERNLLSEQFDEPFEELMRSTWPRVQCVQKAEAFETVFNSPSCESADLARSMWERAPSAEVWLGRRTAFTQSLATMSMVGYILGLGDRHMGNIMLNMSSGRIAHIDFGDSFDVCRVRNTIPETVPFRLTRILIHAMEVFGVDGVFRSTSISILSLLHHHRDSIIALLSAFIYDPIVSHQESMRSILERQSAPQNIVERIRNKLRGLELAVPDEQFQPFDNKGATSLVARPDIHFVSHAFNDDAKRDASAALAPKAQVDMLIAEATNLENLSSMYYGWAPLW